MRIGMIEYGMFGRLLAELLVDHATVVVLDKKGIDKKELPDEVHAVESISSLSGCNAILLAIELASLESVCTELVEVVDTNTVVADVCSVKVKPAQSMVDILGGRCQLLATHPLFGPQTILQPSDTKGQTMAWHELTGGDFSSLRHVFEQEMGIEIAEITPEEHDKEMAWVHGLTFFAGKALLSMQPPASTMGTNYYQKLLDLVEVEKGHSDELFMTIQKGNPYTDEVRRAFLEKLQILEDRIMLP